MVPESRKCHAVLEGLHHCLERYIIYLCNHN